MTSVSNPGLLTSQMMLNLFDAHLWCSARRAARRAFPSFDSIAMASFAGRSYDLFNRVERILVIWCTTLINFQDIITREVSLRGNGDVNWGTAIEEQFPASAELRRGLNKFRSYHTCHESIIFRQIIFYADWLGGDWNLPSNVTLKESYLPHAKSVQVSVIPFL